MWRNKGTTLLTIFNYYDGIEVRVKVMQDVAFFRNKPYMFSTLYKHDTILFMECTIVASGKFENTPQIIKLIKNSECIICADGGARHLRTLNIVPDILIGDFDSITPEDITFLTSESIKTISFPSKKDKTDTELCIDWAIEHGANSITLIGVTGTRQDHTLANIFLLKKMALKKVKGKIIDKNNEIQIAVDKLVIKGNPRDFLSLIPISDRVRGIKLKGLEYPLDHDDILLGSTLGISNRFLSNSASISVESGLLLVIKSKD